MGPFDESAEIKLFQALAELSGRILSAQTLEQRVELRKIASSLRDELVSLVRQFPVPSEEDRERMYRQNAALALIPKIGEN
jgi:hypothetical protein